MCAVKCEAGVDQFCNVGVLVVWECYHQFDEKEVLGISIIRKILLKKEGINGVC